MESNIRVSISSCTTTPPEAELALQVTITNREEGTEIRPPPKKIRIYSKIFLLKKLISTIFLQEKKV